jgi:hypothetical protein
MQRLAGPVIAVIVSIAATGVANAVPQTIAFTGRLSDANGPVDGSVSLTLELYSAETNGTQLWAETHTTMARQGLIAIGMGDVTPLDPTDFDGADVWLEVAVDGQTLGPRLAVRSVPFALHAAVADVAESAETASTVGGISPADIQQVLDNACAAGSGITAISPSGAATCQAFGDVTGVSAGAGLAGGGTSGDVSLGVDFTAAQARVTGTCAGQVIASIAADGSVTCEADNDSGGDITGINTGYGLSGGTGSGTATLTVSTSTVATKDIATTQTFTGVLSAPNFTYPSARSFSLQLPAPAWVDYESSTMSEWNWDGYRTTLDAITGAGYATTGVRLPDGATITALACDVYDSTSSGDIVGFTVDLRRRCGVSATSSSLASVGPYTTSGVSTSLQTVTDSTISSPVIANNTCAYFLGASWNLTAASTGLRFYGCRIDYTMTTLAP